MLALRNAVCNDRWQEMWQKALGCHRKLQAFHRSQRVHQQPPAFLGGGDASSQEPSPAPSATMSEYLSSPAPTLAVSVAEAPPVPPCLRNQKPRSSVLVGAHSKQIAQKRESGSHHPSSGRNGGVCLCGTPLTYFKGHQSKQYCSDRCRQRAYRKRQTSLQPLSLPSSPLASVQERRPPGAKRGSVFSLR